MGNNEIFEFYETSSKRQCPDCALYREIGIVYSTCGRCMQPTAMNRQYNKDRYDLLLIFGNVLKKYQSWGPWHGQSMRQIIYHRARDMFRKSQTSKERFVRNYSGKMVHRCRLSKVVVWWRLDRREIRQYDALALEDHSYEATPEERGRWQRKWFIF